MNDLPPRPTHPPRPVTATRAAPEKSRLTLGRLLLAVAVLIGLAWWLGRSPSPPATPQTDNTTASAAAKPATASNTAQVIAGPKPTALANVDRARMQVSDNGTVLSIVGGVGREFARDLDAIITAHPGLQRVDITSGGGYSMVGYDAARLIRRNNLVVRVKSHCASICVALWAAANQRQMEANAVLGLHQWTAQCDVMSGEERRQCERVAQFATEVSTTYEAWLRSAGFSPRLIALQASTAAHDIAVLRPDQLRAEGVDFTVVPPSAP